MKKIILSLFCYKINVAIIVLLLIESSYENELINLDVIKTNLSSAVYYISTKNYDLYNNLIFNRKEEIFHFSSRYENSMKSIRIIQLKDEHNIYLMELIKIKMFIGINETSSNYLSLYDNTTFFKKNNSKLHFFIIIILNISQKDY